MFASRVVCSRLSSRRPHGGAAVAAGLVLPPRRVVSDIILPAGESLVNFAFLKESRENFIDMANKGIINVDMLGIPLSLALFSGLNSPLMEKYKFNVVEFGKGAKAALQRYHDIQNALQDEICIWAKETIDLKLSPLKIMELAEKKQTELKLEASEKDTSESLLAQMKQMVTPEYFEQMCSSMIRDTLLLKEINLNYNNWTSQVSNINLLSARAEAIPPKPATLEEIPHLTKEEAQKNDDLINNIYMEHPCVAQIEVVYDVQTTFDACNIHKDNNDNNNNSTKVANPVIHKQTDIMEDDDTNLSNASKKPIKASGKVIAVFEGWLFGSPTGSLQWKLGITRPFSF